MGETERCSASGCGRSAASSLDTRPFCEEHFLSTCYEQLEHCTQRLHDQKFHFEETESIRHFLTECARQTTDMAQTAEHLDNLQRAQLLDILLWAGELSRQLQRSTRKAISIRVRLCSEWPGRAWEEETATHVLSRHGAMLECQHPVETGETLQVVRLDTGHQAPARVVWHRRRSSGRVELGVAFPDSENFWDFS